MSGGRQGAWSDRLQCDLVSIHVINEHELEVLVGSGHVTDMRGMIKLAQAVLPGVRMIVTNDQGSRTTIYFLNPESRRWESRRGESGL